MEPLRSRRPPCTEAQVNVVLWAVLPANYRNPSGIETLLCLSITLLISKVPTTQYSHKRKFFAATSHALRTCEHHRVRSRDSSARRFFHPSTYHHIDDFVYCRCLFCFLSFFFFCVPTHVEFRKSQATAATSNSSSSLDSTMPMQEVPIVVTMIATVVTGCVVPMPPPPFQTKYFFL